MEEWLKLPIDVEEWEEDEVWDVALEDKIGWFVARVEEFEVAGSSSVE